MYVCMYVRMYVCTYVRPSIFLTTIDQIDFTLGGCIVVLSVVLKKAPSSNRPVWNRHALNGHMTNYQISWKAQLLTNLCIKIHIFVIM